MYSHPSIICPWYKEFLASKQHQRRVEWFAWSHTRDPWLTKVSWNPIEPLPCTVSQMLSNFLPWIPTIYLGHSSMYHLPLTVHTQSPRSPMPPTSPLAGALHLPGCCDTSRQAAESSYYMEQHATTLRWWALRAYYSFGSMAHLVAQMKTGS